MKWYTPIFALVLGWSALAQGLQYNLVEGCPDVYLDPASERIGHTWVNGLVWDKPLIEKFYRVLKAHDPAFVMLDLGAQTGSFSLLAKYFPKSQWYSFEPIQEAALTLMENLRLNGIKNVFVHQVAVSDVAGMKTLKMPAQNAWGLSTLGDHVLRFTPVMDREVTCIDLDSFVVAHQTPKIDFMKLDTEGWELYILKGGKAMIARDRPIILMEYNETNMQQCDVTRAEVDAFLEEMGYEWQLISSEDILCIPKE